MNPNQIINMIIRVVMRKAINKGIDTGLKKAGSLGRKAPPAAAPHSGNGLTKEQVRAQRRARREGRNG